MTPPARPDPVAALEEALSDADFGKNDGGFDNGRPDRNIRQLIGYLRDRGYVLVNADMLDGALHQAMCDVSHHDQWSVCKNQRRYELIAASALAALKGPAR